MELITTCQTPLGSVTMACSQEGLTGLWFEGQKYFGLTLSPEYQTGDSSAFDQARQWLEIYFSGKKTGLSASACPERDSFPPGCLEGIDRNPLREYGHIQGDRRKNRRPKKCAFYVFPGCGAGCRPQSHFHHHSLPQGGGEQRQSHRLCRRDREKNPASSAGAR